MTENLTMESKQAHMQTQIAMSSDN